MQTSHCNHTRGQVYRIASFLEKLEGPSQKVFQDGQCCHEPVFPVTCEDHTIVPQGDIVVRHLMEDLIGRPLLTDGTDHGLAVAPAVAE